jgi:anti-repressor protein
MNAVEVFQSPTGQRIRLVTRGDQTLFCVADVCGGLQHSNPSVALRLVDDDDKVLIDTRDADIPNLNRTSINPSMWFVTESGFYALALNSQAPGAKVFRRWVTHEVLPAIRKTGSYQMAPTFQLPQTFAEALRELASTVEERDAAVAQVAELTPKAELASHILDADGDLSVADAAKVLSRDSNIRLGQQRLFTVLAEYGWIYRQHGDTRWRVYQVAVERGWLSELPASHYHPRTGELVLDAPQVRVLPKGLLELHHRLGGHAPSWPCRRPESGGLAGDLPPPGEPAPKTEKAPAVFPPRAPHEKDLSRRSQT